MFWLCVCVNETQLVVSENATAKRNTDEFTAVENGASATGLTEHRLSRQVSLRVRRKTIVRKAAARDTWMEAADKVRVRLQRSALSMLLISACI